MIFNLLHVFVGLLVFLFCLFVCLFVCGSGTREVLTIDYKYNSAVQGATITSRLHNSLKREPSTRDLASPYSFVGQSR